MLVPAEFKADYVRTVEVAELHGSLLYSLREEAEDIRKYVDELGVNGGLYLKVLDGLMTHFGERYEKAGAEIRAAKEQLENSRNGAGSNAFGAFKEAFSAFEEVTKKIRYVEHPNVLYRQLHNGINQLEPDLQETYLSLMSAAQDARLWLEPSDAQSILEDMQKKEGVAAVKAVLQSAVEALTISHNEFFSFVGAHGVPDYVISKYVEAAPSNIA